MSEKLCIFCNHMRWDAIEYWHISTITGGMLQGGASCGKGHYHGMKPEDERILRLMLLRAETCPDYDEAK